MAKRYFNFVVALLLALGFSASAQFVTTGNKAVYTFETLSQIDTSGVTAVSGAYYVAQDIEIAATDTLRINEGDYILLGDDVVIKIYGYGDLAPESYALVTRDTQVSEPQGFRFYDDSKGTIKNIRFEYCAVRLGGDNPIKINNCEFIYTTNAMSSTGAISLSAAIDGFEVTNCTFTECEVPAIGGAANYATGVVFKNNYMYDCNSGNSNRPFVNLTAGGEYPVVVENNIIIGAKRTRVGGIAVSNMLGLSGTNVVTISNNKIVDCRYGITTNGKMNVSITGNYLVNNCYETNAMNGGSGISIYDSNGNQNAMVTGNYIENSLWGITVIGGGDINLGRTDVETTDSNYNPGQNTFLNNGNGGVLYDLYNNSTKTIYAQGNTWGVETQDSVSIEGVITHKNDISSLGEIVFMPASARKLAPHTLTASKTFDNVSLSWKAPNDEKSLCWHDGEDYNGYDGVQTDPEGTCTLIAGAKFTTDELSAYIGNAVDTIAFFEYREVVEAYAQIYENGTLVVNQKIDLSNFVKNSWRKVALDEKYYISGGVDLIFAIKMIHGYNQTFVGITDRAAHDGKGNLVSTDEGKTWQALAPGDFLITAQISKQPSETPVGYKVYRDNEAVNAEAITETSYTLTGEAEGSHIYSVAAVYDDVEKLSENIELDIVPASKIFPSVATISGTVTDGLNGTISWQAPLKRDTVLTWSGDVMGNKIGGTSTSSPKVWIKHEFDANDLLAYPNHQITAINAYFGENTINTATVFVIKNGTIDYSQEISADSIAMITAGAWFKFVLNTPYKFEQGNTYAFGCYYTHTASTHPVGVDNLEAVDEKGNEFSTSSPRSSGFNNSSPSWKTLSSGNIAGNFMLKADIEALGEVGEAPVVDYYNVYRGDVVVASGIKDLSYSETSSELGAATYSVVAVGTNGYSSEPKEVELTYTLPDSFTAPVITSSDFDDSTKQFSMAWSNDAVELKQYVTPSYMIGFSEDIDMIYGAKFPTDEISNLSGYVISNIKFALGDTISSFKLELYSGTENIYSTTVDGSVLSTGVLYTMTLENPVNIPTGKDLYLVYNASLSANTTPIIIDAGPANDNGAVVSLTGGTSWLKLGTIASSYSGYNIVIAATAMPGGSSQSEVKAITLGSTLFPEMAKNKVITDIEEYGIEGVATEAAPVKVQAKADESTSSIEVSGYRVYSNGALKAELDADNNSYSEIITRYGEYSYTVTNVYSNGWESAESKTVSFDNFIEQTAQAPYDLTGTATGKDLALTWDAIDADATVMKYHSGDSDMAVGMTGSGTREGYQVIKFTADTLATVGHVGDSISHIKFKLASADIYTAAVLVMYGDNIVYEQPIDVSNIVAGWNTVRLNNPVAVPEGVNVSFGYHLTYANGVKPLSTDAGPVALASYSDLISSSASSGYWYSLATRYKLSYNWRIEGYFKKADQVIKDVAAAPALADETATTTYNVYRDGSIVASGITEKQYTVTEAETGSYTVTAVVDGVESAESNAVIYDSTVGVSAITANGVAYYDRAADQVVFTAASDAKVYTINGSLVKDVTDAETIDMSDIASGAYIVKSGTAVIKIVK